MCKLSHESRVHPHPLPHDRRLSTVSMEEEAENEAIPATYVWFLGKPQLFGDSECDSEPVAMLQRIPIIWVEGAIIVGAGPAGLATAACLQRKGVPSLVLEREDCIGSLWRYRTYDRLRLHIAKNYCELPYLPFPSCYPTFPGRVEFLEYLEHYARSFNIKPLFKECVIEASYSKGAGLWQIESRGSNGKLKTFVGRWLIVATGENAQPVWPQLSGLTSFTGKAFHTSAYKCGKEFLGKKVLVVGCGNSGLEVSLDLVNHNADVFMSIRSEVHVLPREILGISTFSMAMMLLRVFSLRWTDRVLLGMSRLILGETGQLGFHRPSEAGPMEMKGKTGKTPSLDAGTLRKIREGYIQVCPGILEFDANGCIFVDHSYQTFDAVIFATGFRSNVPSWLKDHELFSVEGYPNQGFWKGKNGLYSSGFSRKGLLGVAADAQRIAEDISKCYAFPLGLKCSSS